MPALTCCRPSTWILLAILAGCSRESPASLASRGKTDAHAPVRATASITVKAPPLEVWRILSDIHRWPEWQHDIQTTSLSNAPAIGVPFVWTTAAGTIHSRIMLFEPDHRIAWVGRLLIFHAIHVWTLDALPNGETAVQTNESMTGWPIRWFYSSQDLLQDDQRWLASLKRKLES